MHPIYIFILAGAFAMSGALSARELVAHTLSSDLTANNTSSKTPSKASEKGVDATSGNNASSKLAWYYLLAGNLAVVALVMAMVYGWQSFAWWVSVACLVVSFPALHYILLQRFLAAKIRVIMYPVFAWVMLVPIVMHWLS